jgi:16S rRNA (guanine527-N7)-methyltransferase
VDRGAERRRLLLSGASELGLALTGEQCDRLLGLLALLERWGRAYNLTAVRDPLRMIPHHLLDSLAVAPLVSGSPVLDMGTGAGFPGLPLAIAQPARRFVLLDANGKKIRFVRQALLTLPVPNAEAVQSRMESYKSGEKFATIVARAFAPLPEVLRLAHPLLRPGGVLLALKGPGLDRELDALAGVAGDLRVHRLRVPSLERERSVVALRPA